MRLHSYHIPKTLDEALALLDAEVKEGRETHLLAGGTDLMVRAREGRWKPQVIVQIEGLSELEGIVEDGSRLRLGARVSFSQILASPLIAQFARGLALASHEIGAPQIQSRGTVGGQLGTASPVGDLIPPLLVLEADVLLRSVEGERRIPISGFLLGVSKTQRRPNELILGVEFEKARADDHWIWFKLGPRRAQSISKVSLAGLVRLSADRKIEVCRLAYGAVAITAKRVAKTESLLTGKTLTPELAREATQTVMTEVSPITDLRSTEPYRRKMCGVLLRRGLAPLIDS